MIDYQVQRISDGALVRVAAALVDMSDTGEATFNLLGGQSVSLTASERLNEETRSLLTGTSFVIMSANIVVEEASFSLEFRRGQVHGVQPSGYAAWHVPSTSFIDGIRIEGPRGPLHTRILKVITAELSLGPPGGRLEGGAAQSGEAIIQRLNDAVASALNHTLERQQNLDKLREQLARDAEERIAIETTRLSDKHADRMEALLNREREFDKRVSTFDDRSNTHVRRGLQRAMADLSESTLKQRLFKRSEIAFALPVLMALLTAFVLAAYIVTEIRSLDTLANAIATIINDAEIRETRKPALIAGVNSSIMFGQVRVGLQTVGAGLLVWFALGLTRQRYRQTSRWEHDLHRFRLDTERASFLIEGELEARRLNGMVLPEVVLDRFSRGLFSNGSDDRAVEGIEVGTTLAHLLNKPARLKIGPNGMEAEIDKAGIKSATKEAASGSSDDS